MQAIIDASSLIILARENTLWLLNRVFDVVALVPDVEREAVVQGRARGFPDATRIETAIVTGQLVVISPTATEERLAVTICQSVPGLSRSDCITLACAKERNLKLVIEDRRGRRAAIVHGIDYVVIQTLPLHGFIAQQLSFVECTDLLNRIGKAMHTDPAILNVLHAAADEIHRLRSA